MTDYCGSSDIKATIPESSFSSSTDADIDIAWDLFITRASRLIDKEVGGWDNYFCPSTDGETRYYDGSGELEQWIDPCVSLTGVSVSESDGRQAADYTDWTEDTDYYVWPYNYSDIGKPIEKLVVDNDSGNKGVWDPVRKGVKVTGIFGYSLTPPDIIKQACITQVIKWYMRSKQNWQDASANATVGELMYMQDLDPAVKRMLRPYQLHNMV